MAKYRGAVIGLGWMGLLYDLAQRMGVWHVDDIERPTPELNIHRRFPYHKRYMRQDFIPTSYSEALWDRPEIELVAAAERDRKRLAAFEQRYDIQALYTDAKEMLRQEKPDIVAIASNTKGRSELTCYAVECGAKGIITEKPIAYSLEEADRMVETCAAAGVPLCTGAISTNHPSFAQAKELMTSGAIGEILSIEAVSDQNLSQHQNWSYFVDEAPAWVIGVGDEGKRESGSGEFRGQGVMGTQGGQLVHFRKGAPALRISGSGGEILHPNPYAKWILYQDVETSAGLQRVEMPWPGPQIVVIGGMAICGLADVIDCLEGRLDEPKNSGRRVATALEVELALKQSAAQGGQRVELPLKDRAVEMEYDWHR